MPSASPSAEAHSGKAHSGKAHSGKDCDVAIIGAGPSGTVAAKFLHDAGLKIIILEKYHLPRFVIGESLLPNCMNVLERCGILPAVEAAGFQFKDGAIFERGPFHSPVDFRSNFETEGWGTTFQVQRDRFDTILAEEVSKAGVEIRQGHGVTAARLADGDCQLTVRNDAGETGLLSCGFVLDASGYGRVLPRLLDLVRPSKLRPRRALFTHMRDHMAPEDHDRNKILITVHPNRIDIWYWLIPFSDGTASVGVVFPEDDVIYREREDQHVFRTLIRNTRLGAILARAEPIRPMERLSDYSAHSTRLHGDGYALVGNAGAFLDPVFSSGVTIAMVSAEMAAKQLIRRHRGESVDWEADYAEPLMQGVRTFESYVNAWYDGRFQTILFNRPDGENNPLTKMVISILAGYAWNRNNPLVAQTDRYLAMLHDLCA
ncbi:MAG: tryptophan 7-halogenase [Rhodospirillum sp.]|nr:tryptophan 7-halogenase [Rhodospirillum sp.]MCF8490845.1 tryptophan 7-halogenase [Rhodospirillum sp.]